MITIDSFLAKNFRHCLIGWLPRTHPKKIYGNILIFNGKPTEYYNVDIEYSKIGIIYKENDKLCSL